MILVILGNGVVANVLLNRTKGQSSGWMVITTGWGLAVTVAVYSVGRISGAHINPAVTFGLASIGAFSWSQVPGYLLAQMLGAVLGAVIVYLVYLPHWAETEDSGAKLAAFCTAPAIPNRLANFMTEVIATAMLLFGILAISANSAVFAKPGRGRSLGCLQNGPAAFAGGFPGLVYRALSGRTDGLCHQPRPRPGTAYCLRSPSHSREGKSGLGLQLESRLCPDSGGCFGGLALCDGWFLIPERK